jgi:hypothetical protein
MRKRHPSRPLPTSGRETPFKTRAVPRALLRAGYTRRQKRRLTLAAAKRALIAQGLPRTMLKQTWRDFMAAFPIGTLS